MFDAMMMYGIFIIAAAIGLPILFMKFQGRIKSIWISNTGNDEVHESIDDYNDRVIKEANEFIDRIKREGDEAIENDPLSKEIDQSIINMVELMESSHPNRHVRGYDKNTFDHKNNGYWIGHKVLRYEDFH